MTHTLPPLPYAIDALAPYISAETLSYHHGKHHQAYVNNLNALVAGTAHATSDLETLIQETTGSIFNNAAQVWNHTFYWHCLSPNVDQPIPDPLATQLTEQFGSIEAFKETFTRNALTLFGSGWTWLVQQRDGRLAITQTLNANTPIQGEETPLLTCDVWEHAYYIDTRNARPAYVDNFWRIVNWQAVNDRLA